MTVRKGYAHGYNLKAAACDSLRGRPILSKVRLESEESTKQRVKKKGTVEMAFSTIRTVGKRSFVF